MIDALFQALGIQTKDGGKLAALGPIFFLTGLAYVIGILSSQSLFVSRFGAKYLPLMYLAEAAILPLQLWLVSYLSQRMPRGKLIKQFYLIILSGMAACGIFIVGMIGFGIQWRGFYPLLFLTASVLLRILVPLMWMLGNGICLLQQAKRLFPILSAIFTLGAVGGGFLARGFAAFLTGVGTEVAFLCVPVLLLLTLFLWLRVISQYFLAKDLEGEEQHSVPMKSVIKTVLATPLLKIALAGFIILMGLYYTVDYQFFIFASRSYPKSDNMTQFYGMFVAALYVVSLLISLLLNRLIKRVGIGKMVLMTGVLTAFILLGSGLGANGSWALQAFIGADLLIDVLAFTLLPMLNEVFFKLLPAPYRTGASLLFAGTVNAAGKLLSFAVTGLYSAGMISLVALSILGFVLALGYLYLSWREKHLYFSTLMDSLQSHTVRVPELDSFSPGQNLGKKDIIPLQTALQCTDVASQAIALEFAACLKSDALFLSIMPFLEDPDRQKRFLAIQAIPVNLNGADQLYRRALEDPAEEVRCEAIRALKQLIPDTPRLQEILADHLDDPNAETAGETIIALYRIEMDTDLRKRIHSRILNMLKGDDENRFNACRIIQITKMEQYAETIKGMLAEKSSPRVRNAAVRCLGKLGFFEAVPFLLASYAGADRELKQSIEAALTDMGEGAADTLLQQLSSGDLDNWYLSVITLAGLDRQRRFERPLFQSCEEKLKSWRSVTRIPALMEQEGMADLAALYRMRTMESFSVIMEACWRILSVYFDPALIDRLKPALTQMDSEEKREQGVEILAELAQHYPLTADMACAFQGEGPPGESQPLHLSESLTRAKQEFSEYWLDRFADYALAGYREGGVLSD